jgi:tetratricopeptide (TPR) repeat protein
MGYREILNRTQPDILAMKEYPDQFLMEVKLWLESKASGDWLLVIDNLDDIDVAIGMYLPKINGAILFTTRDQRLALMYKTSQINLEVMSREDARETFFKLMGVEHDPTLMTAVDTLHQLLGGLPLAISQATAYIRETISISKTESILQALSVYIEHYVADERNQEHLLSEPIAQEGVDNGQSIPRSVIGTWDITIQKIQTTCPNSVTLLRLMSFLDPDRIPATLLLSSLTPGPNNLFTRYENWQSDLATRKESRSLVGKLFRRILFAPSKNDVELDLNEIMRHLLRFSLVTRLEDNNYRLHRLVSLWTRVRINPAIKEAALRSSLDVLSQNFPARTFETATICTSLMPHASSVRRHIERSGMTALLDIDMASSLYNNVGWHLWFQAKYEEALEWHRRALAGRKKVLGSEHPDTLRSIDGIASCLGNQGKHDEALEWYRRALAGQEKVLGSEHTDTLLSIDGIARCLANQGKFEEALEWHRRALAGQEKVLGSEHPDTLLSIDGIAICLGNQGKYEEALEWHRRALAGQEKGLGSEHPDTLRSIDNLASMLHDQGKYDEAIEWQRRALAGQEKVLGSEHPDTLLSIDGIARYLANQGKFEEALEWHRRALAGQEKVLGSEHPDTLLSIDGIARCLANQGKYDEALEWRRRALAGQEKVLGSEHPDTLYSIDNIARCLANQGKYDEALEWRRRALAGQEKVLGSEHPDTLRSIGGIAICLTYQGKYDEAVEWQRRALAGQEKVLGTEHPDTLRSIDGIASCLGNQGKYEEALEWHRRALAGEENVLGSEHPDTLRSIDSIAICLGNQGKYEEALEWHRRTLAGREKVLGSEHPDTLCNINNIASMLHNQGKYDEAVEGYRRALAGRQKVLGHEHPATQQSFRYLRDSRNKANQHKEGTARNHAPSLPRVTPVRGTGQ